MDDKEFTLNVAKYGDAVVQEGSVEKNSLTSKYFGEYEEALDYLKEQCSNFVKEQ